MNLSLGWPVTKEQFREVANYAGVLEVEDYFLDARFERECERMISNTEKIEPEYCIHVAAFLFLNTRFSLQAVV